MPPAVREPSNDELREELLRQSYRVFGPIGLGGILGPTWNHYDDLRLPKFPWSGYILDMYGLTRNTEGWSYLLMCFELQPPTRGESKEAWYKRREQRDAEIGGRADDEEWPELSGHWSSSTTVFRRGDGCVERVTRRIFHVR